MFDHQRSITARTLGFNRASRKFMDRSGSQVERPADDTGLRGIAPVARKRLLYRRHGIDAVRRDITGGGGPRAQVAGELGERPAHLQLAGGKRYLIEREWNRPVPIEQ